MPANHEGPLVPAPVSARDDPFGASGSVGAGPNSSVAAADTRADVGSSVPGPSMVAGAPSGSAATVDVLDVTDGRAEEDPLAMSVQVWFGVTDVVVEQR